VHPYPRWRPTTPTHGNPKVAAVCWQILAVLNLFFWGPPNSPQFRLAQVLLQDRANAAQQLHATGRTFWWKEQEGAEWSQNFGPRGEQWLLGANWRFPESFMNEMLWLQG